MRGLWTRRGLLALGSSCIASLRLGAGRTPESSRNRIFTPDWRRFPDPVTEIEVYRLTAPAYTSHLPSWLGRSIARHNQFVLFGSNRGGSMQAWRMDQKTGDCRQLTDAEALDASSINLMPGDRAFCFFDGPSLRLVNLSNLREREIYRIPEGWNRNPGSNVTDDGLRAMLCETRAGSSRLRLVNMAKGIATTVLEGGSPMLGLSGRPKRDQILYRQREQGLWLVNFDGRQNRRLRTAEGGLGPARWGPDGKTILYLHFPPDRAELNSIREHTPDENLDRQVARTSQFVHFGFNGDSSVFVGASRNTASPDILILLRLTRRELTICEHRASNAAAVAPVFSPNSQYIYFTSDKEGLPAIYRVRMDRFVAETDTGGDEPL